MGEFTIHLTEEQLVRYAEELLQKNIQLEVRLWSALNEFQAYRDERAKDTYWRDRKAHNRRLQLR